MIYTIVHDYCYMNYPPAKASGFPYLTLTNMISLNPHQPIIHWTLPPEGELSFYNVSVSGAMGFNFNGTLPVVPTVRLKTIVKNIYHSRKQVKLIQQVFWSHSSHHLKVVSFLRRLKINPNDTLFVTNDHGAQYCCYYSKHNCSN